MPAFACPEREKPGRAAPSRRAPLLQPSAPLSFGLVDGRPLFMDERDDSYFMLEPDQEARFLKSLQARSARDPVDHLRQDDGTDDIVDVRECERPVASLLDGTAERPRVGLADVACLLPILVSVRANLRRGQLSRLLARARSCPGSDVAAGRALLLERSLRFAAARKFVPIKANCLLDSLSLLRFLGSAARTATLVFGVKLDPFAAHCWVQTPDLLLNDRYDHVSRFVPVRTVPCSPVTP